MTAQFADRLLYDGEGCSMFDMLLDMYFYLAGSRAFWVAAPHSGAAMLGLGKCLMIDCT